MAAAMVTVCAFAAPQKGGRDKANDRNGERPAEFQRENEKGDRPDMPDSGQKPSRPMNNGDFDFDDLVEKTAEKLESVTDEELKAELNSLLEEYKTAAAALQSAVESKEDEQSLKSLRESTDSARKALANALKEAGIEVGGSKPKDNDGDKKPDKIKLSEPSESEPSAEQESGSGGFFSAIMNWFGNLFK